MELALSVGSRSEPSRNRCLFGISDDQIQQRLLLNVREDQEGYGSTNRSPVQLDLKLSWSTEMGNVYDGRSSDHTALNRSDFDVNQVPSSNGGDEGDQEHSSSTSRAITNCQKRSWEMEVEKTSSRCSDEDEGGSTRKKLRLSKEQSAYLEESFKEHTTLNPKQKAALAKQLNLRPRQVEVWFQNRRARTKLKQTEVDLEYLKRCCESLTEENRRLHKELEDLKSLKTHHPLHLHVPATTLTMCPTCERGKGSRIMGGTNFHSHPHHHASAAT